MYYITEKIWDAFAAQTIPIFWGDPLIDSYGIFNPRSFVNVHDFPTIRDVVDRIVRIDNDDELYLSMLREPALIDSKSREEWIADVEKYLLKIVNTPKEKAIQRDCSFYQGWYEKGKKEVNLHIYKGSAKIGKEMEKDRHPQLIDRMNRKVYRGLSRLWGKWIQQFGRNETSILCKMVRFVKEKMKKPTDVYRE